MKKLGTDIFIQLIRNRFGVNTMEKIDIKLSKICEPEIVANLMFEVNLGKYTSRFPSLIESIETENNIEY